MNNAKKRTVKLTDVCDFQGGSQPPKEEWIYDNQDGYIRMLQIREFTQDRTGKEEYVKLTNSTKICTADDILIARYGASLGKILTGMSGAYNVAIMKTIPNENVLSKKYLYFYLSSRLFQHHIMNLSSRAAQAGFNKDDLKTLLIPLPSLDLQSLITDNLNKVTELINLRKQRLAELDNLIKSRFIEMFGDPVTNPMGWEKVPLSECLERIESGNSFNCKPHSRNGSNPAILKLSAVTYGIYNPDENKELPVNIAFDERVEVLPGDLLFSRKNTLEMVGMSAYVYNTPPNLMLPDLIFRLITRENCDKVYLWQLINHPESRLGIQSLASGSAASMPNISKQRLMHHIIPLPPLPLQTRFAEFVQAADKSKFYTQKSIEESQLLFDSLMSRYFE